MTPTTPSCPACGATGDDVHLRAKRGNWVCVRIPHQAEHRFHGKPNSHSTASRTPVPRQAGQ